MGGSPGTTQASSPDAPLCSFFSSSSGLLATPSTCWTHFCLRPCSSSHLTWLCFLRDFTPSPSGLYSNIKPPRWGLLWPPNLKLQPVYTLAPCPEISCPFLVLFFFMTPIVIFVLYVFHSFFSVCLHLVECQLHQGFLCLVHYFVPGK